ncbi:MAG: hypothetical protein H7301_10995 [Cryobacterium sp.]|nr:hypothetical protein [Oligoflexia bacterium]
MKTITEFFGKSLKAIEEKIPAYQEELKTSVPEQLKADGKSEEEVTAGLEEALKAALHAKVGTENKLEGDKLAMLFNAMEVSRGVRGNLKRVIVMVPASETEKAPSSAKEIDGKFYFTELFPEAGRAAAPAGDDRFGGRGGKGGRGGRDGKGGRDGGGRGPGRGEGRGEGRGAGRGGEDRAPRRAPAEGATVIGITAGPSAGALAPNHVAVPKDGRGPRKPKAPRAPVEPYKGPNRIVIAGGAATPPPAATSSEHSAPAEAPTTDGTSA